jgi:hypothetical protein
MENLNPYNKEKFKINFLQNEIYKKLRLNYAEDKLVWDKFFFSDDNVRANKIKFESRIQRMPRDMYSDYFSVNAFYYLLPLLEKPYEKIYDIGCGPNMFKPYIPRLIGVGAEELAVVHNYNNIKDSSWPEISIRAEYKSLPAWIKEECKQHGLNCDLTPFYGDEHGFVDDDYVAQHQNYFESVFSICALHFHPIDQFCKVVEDFASMIQINGRGFISINLQRMIDFSSAKLLISLFDTVHPTQDQLDKYIRNELDKINLEWLIVDVDLMLVDEGMDGNIRLVFKK